MKSSRNKIRPIDIFDSIIERMLQAVLSDLAAEIKQEEAGWRHPADLGIKLEDQAALFREGIIERNVKGQIRFNLSSRIRQNLKGFNFQFKQLDYFLKNREIINSDIEKVKKTRDIIIQISKRLQSSPEAWAYVAAIGWWKMLESSGMPALIDDILKEGFSPRNWTIKATLSSHHLALSIAKRFGKIEDLKEAINYLDKMGIFLVETPDLQLQAYQNEVQKIKKVLKWEDIEKRSTDSNIKTLAFFWLSIFVIESSNLFPLSGELSATLFDVIWAILENILGKDRLSLLRELEGTINKLIQDGISWASDILHMPEVL